jgi:hypothetical protein
MPVTDLTLITLCSRLVGRQRERAGGRDEIMNITNFVNVTDDIRRPNNLRGSSVEDTLIHLDGDPSTSFNLTVSPKF